MKKKNLVVFSFFILNFIFYNLKPANSKYYKNPKGFNIQKEKPAQMYRNLMAFDNSKSYKRESPIGLKKFVDPYRASSEKLVKCIGCGNFILGNKKQNPSKNEKTKIQNLWKNDGFNKKNTWSDNCF